MSIARFHKQTSGQAMSEFIVVFPVLFLLFLVIVQTTLLMVAKQFVAYSAFCAARSAIVHNGNYQKINRAANIALIPIVPKLTTGILGEFRDYAISVGDTLFTSLPQAIDQYPELAGLILSWGDIPGLQIIQRLQNLPNVDIENLIGAQNSQDLASMTEGLNLLDQLCRAKDNVPRRYPAAAVLTQPRVSMSAGGRDVTVEITHDYAMRVPIVNKIFMYAYIQLPFKQQIESGLQGLPNTTTDVILNRAADALWELCKASTTYGLYLMPIKGSSTLSMEVEAKTLKNCN